jgi:hypothetical protein
MWMAETADVGRLPARAAWGVVAGSAAVDTQQ